MGKRTNTFSPLGLLLQDVEGCLDRRQHQRRDRGAEDEGTAGIDEVLDDRPGSGHESAVKSQGLPKCRDHGTGAPLDAKVFGQARASLLAKDTQSMGVIDDQVSSPSLGHPSVHIKWSDITVHAEKRFGDQEGPSLRVRDRERFGDRPEVQMGKDHFLASAQPQPVNDTRVVLPIRQDSISRSYQGAQQSDVRLVSTGEDQRGFASLEPTQPFFELQMRRSIASQETRGR